MSNYNKYKEVQVLSVPDSTTYRVHGKVYDGHNTYTEVDHTVEAKDEHEAFQKVFGVDSHIPAEVKEDPYRDDPYLAFLRET